MPMSAELSALESGMTLEGRSVLHLHWSSKDLGPIVPNSSRWRGHRRRAERRGQFEQQYIDMPLFQPD